jgi:hypothetical protein
MQRLFAAWAFPRAAPGRWGSRDLPPQAGIGVYKRGPDGLLAAARTYDDVEPPDPGGLPDAPQP